MDITAQRVIAVGVAAYLIFSGTAKIAHEVVSMLSDPPVATVPVSAPIALPLPIPTGKSPTKFY